MQQTADAVLNAALKLGESRSWEAVRLFDVAEELGTDLNAVRHHFREKEDLVDAWFDRADAAMLRAAADPAVSTMPPTRRIETLVLAWLDALDERRRLTGQMIAGKLEFGHLHVQFPAVLRISRTVQWLREGAGRDATGAYRGLEETALTSIFVSTFVVWLRAGGDHRATARGYLRRALSLAQRVSRWVPGYLAHHGRRRERLPAPQAGVRDSMPDGTREQVT